MNYREERCGRIGDPIPEPRPVVFELVVADHVPAVGAINPHEYFITSGDAVSKARMLQKDLVVAGHTAEAAGAGLLVAYLELARGDAIFLETEWSHEHRLLCIPKNPRSRPDPL